MKTFTKEQIINFLADTKWIYLEEEDMSRQEMFETYINESEFMKMITFYS